MWSRYALELVAILLALASLSACTRRKDPQLAFDHAIQTFRHGDLTRAQSEIAKDYQDFRAIGPEWAWKFRILEAEILAWRGMSDCELGLLDSKPATTSAGNCGVTFPISESAAPSGENAVKLARLKGTAYASKHLFQEAEHTLAEAERLCSVSDYPPCAEVTSAQGVVAMERGNFAEGQHTFERALTLVRTRGNRFLEANALLDLSWAALQQEQFDKAVDWADAASRLATAIEAGYVG